MDRNRYCGLNFPPKVSQHTALVCAFTISTMKHFLHPEENGGGGEEFTKKILFYIFFAKIHTFRHNKVYAYENIEVTIITDAIL